MNFRLSKCPACHGYVVWPTPKLWRRDVRDCPHCETPLQRRHRPFFFLFAAGSFGAYAWLFLNTDPLVQIGLSASLYLVVLSLSWVPRIEYTLIPANVLSSDTVGATHSDDSGIVSPERSKEEVEP